MNSPEKSHKEIFNYLKNSLLNDEVTINHPLNSTTLTRGVITILSLNNSLASKYITEDCKGIVFQATCYHQNFAEINSLNARVRESILNFKPTNEGNTKIIRELFPKFINSLALWQSVINFCWYFEES
jgi:hypothetical protein